jgi:hypothetical protein
MKTLDNKIENYIDSQIEYFKKLSLLFEETIFELHQENNKAEIKENSYYYIYNFTEVYRDEDKLKENHIEDYDGLDDGMTDWTPDSEEVKGKELLELLEKGNELVLMW